MRVEQVTVRRKESYESNPGLYEGRVKIVNEGSTLELQLSAKSMAAIFKVIASDAAAEAMRCASATPRALEEAETEPLLIEQGEI